MYKNAAGLVANRGYQNIKVFKDGIPGWVKAGFALQDKDALPKTEIPSMTAEKLYSLANSVMILDIRTPVLYNMGWIKGSVKIPLEELSTRYNEIAADNRVVLVDHAGKQVLNAALFLKSRGYKDVHRLQGGLMAWISQGYSMEK